MCMRGGTKCIRRNMRSTCQWSCVLQFTWRRAVCCGLHRPMSQVIPCLGLRLLCFILYTLSMSTHERTNHKWNERTWSSGLPWRSPLETNNMRGAPCYDHSPSSRVASTKGFGCYKHHRVTATYGMWVIINDPSAGSPTETLLRLLFPPNHQVWSTLAKAIVIPRHHNVYLQRSH